MSLWQPRTEISAPAHVSPRRAWLVGGLCVLNRDSTALCGWQPGFLRQLETPGLGTARAHRVPSGSKQPRAVARCRWGSVLPQPCTTAIASLTASPTPAEKPKAVTLCPARCRELMGWRCRALPGPAGRCLRCCAAPVPCPPGCPWMSSLPWLRSRFGVGPGWLRHHPSFDIDGFGLGKSPATSPACAKGTQGRDRGTPLAVPGERHIWGTSKPASARGAPGHRCAGMCLSAPSACHSYPRHHQGVLLQKAEGIWVLAAPWPQGSPGPGLRCCPLQASQAL